MIFDAQNLFSDAQALTVTAPSTNVIDTGGADKGGPEEVFLVLVADADLTAAGAATLTVTLQTDDAEGFGTVETVLVSAAIPKTALTAGEVFFSVALPRNLKRYLRLNYTVATGPFTAGSVTAGLVKDVSAFKPYASGFSVGA